MMSTSPQLALVTGAGSGIGKAIAAQLAQNGYKVIIADIRLEAAQRVMSGLVEMGLQAQAVAIDITDSRAVATLIDKLPPLQILVNNAGIFNVKAFFDLCEEDFRQMYEVNTISVFTLSRLAAKKMPAGGRIINIASRSMLGAKEYVHYATSKIAVAGLTRSMALELAQKHITVNAVSPGVIETDMLKARSDTDLDHLRTLQPMGELGSPQHIAHTVAFLAHPQAQFITGQVLMVDGGRSITTASF
ncbi:SDR family NAD(P)-dependent oxidoreductase [Paenalcaligenes hominis]|uniref:SDR family NAD(P)-dependent oxidoreductase n=1 Tax=Paenalcaligenes hominis TaxID=643674 RepID=UPI003526400A